MADKKGALKLARLFIFGGSFSQPTVISAQRNYARQGVVVLSVPMNLWLAHKPKLKGLIMKSKFQGLLVAATLVAATAMFAITPGCATKLEPGGAYAPVKTNADGTVTATAQPDVAFFTVDASYELAYNAIETAFSFERNNRALLWKLSPEIKHGLDSIRPTASQVKLKYARARAAYLANPIPAGLDTLNQVLSEVQALSSAAQAALPKS